MPLIAFQPVSFSNKVFVPRSTPAWVDSSIPQGPRLCRRAWHLARMKRVPPFTCFPVCSKVSLSDDPTSSGFKASIPPVRKVSASTKPLIYVIDAISLINHVQKTFSISIAPSSRSIISRTIRAFVIVLTTLLKQHVRGCPVVAVFPQVTHRVADVASCTISSAVQLCRALGLSVIRPDAEISRVQDVVAAIVQAAYRSEVRSVIVSANNQSVLFYLLNDPWVEALILRRAGTFESITCVSFPTAMGVKSLQPWQIVDVLALVTETSPQAGSSITISMQTAAELVSHFGSINRVLEAAKNRVLHASSLVSQPRSMLTYRLAKHFIQNQHHIVRIKHNLVFKKATSVPFNNWSFIRRKPIDVHNVKILVNNLKISSNNLLTRILQTADEVLNGHPLLCSQSTTLENVGTGLGLIQSHNSNGSDDAQLQPANYQANPSSEDIANFMRNISDHIGILPVFGNSSDCTPIIKGFSICRSKGSVIFIHIHPNHPLPRPVVRILISNSIEKRGWFLKDFVKHLSLNYGVTIAGRLFDIHIASSLLHAGSNLADVNIAERYLPSDNALRRYLNNHQVRNLTLQLVSEHALELCDDGFSLAGCLYQEIISVGLGHVVFNIECPLIPVLASMEANGVPIDANRLSLLHDKLRRRRTKLRRRLQNIMSQSVHIRHRTRLLPLTSMQNVKRLLCPQQNEDQKGRRISDFQVRINQRFLSEVAQDKMVDRRRRVFAHLFLQYKQVTQLLQMHTIPLLRNIGQHACAYPTYVQNAAPSGRLSTSKPNLQSLPIRSIVGGELRRLVRAREGKYIVTADYSQIELRIVASMSDDTNLIGAFAKDVDVHKHIAAKLFNISDASAISDEQRTVAKQVVYSIMYGVSAQGLAKLLGVARRDAEMLISHFFKSYPGVKLLTDQLVEEALITGYAKTLSGRRQRISHIINGNRQERKRAKRVAINMPIQGTQSDMLKSAMAKIWNRLSQMKSRIIMQMHDELILEVDEMEKDFVIKIIVQEMVQATPLYGVDIVVKVGCGKTWLTAAKSAEIVRL